MKKIFLIVFITGCLSGQAFAQDEEEKSFGQGSVIVNASYGFPNLFKTLLQFTDGTNSKTSGWGPLNIGFEYGMGNRFGIGLQTNISSVKKTAQFRDSSGHTYQGTLTLNTFSLLPRLNYHFAITPKVDPYIGAGIGYKKIKFRYGDNSNDPLNNKTISIPLPVAITGAIGMRYYVSPAAGIYAEVGYIAGALLQTGVVVKF